MAHRRIPHFCPKEKVAGHVEIQPTENEKHGEKDEKCWISLAQRCPKFDASEIASQPRGQHHRQSAKPKKRHVRHARKYAAGAKCSNDRHINQPARQQAVE